MKRRDYWRLLLILTIIVFGSMLVPDSRVMTPTKDVLKKPVKEIINHISDAKALVYNDYRQSIIQGFQEERETIEVGIAPIQEVNVQSVIEDENYHIAEEDNEGANESGLIYIGAYEITAYTWTGNPCANGNYPVEGYTIACNDLPFGTRVYIDGVGERVVEDTGGGGYGWMDIYMGTESACYEWGRQYRDVWIVG